MVESWETGGCLKKGWGCEGEFEGLGLIKVGSESAVWDKLSWLNEGERDTKTVLGVGVGKLGDPEVGVGDEQ